MSPLPTVLGVDCASKKSMTFDGICFRDLKPTCLDKLLEDYGTARDAFICWDAPLTGPPSVSQISDRNGAYSMRPIERFCNAQAKQAPLWKAFEVEPPAGINTRGYSGMSHWALTQALTGHPRINDQYHRDPRFPLLVDSHPNTSGPISPSGTQLIEVHPAVALWLWIGTDPRLVSREESVSFAYKASKLSADDRCQRTQALVARLLAALDRRLQREPLRDVAGEALIYGQLTRDGLRADIGGDHNKLDAYVAWVLGRLLACGRKEVTLLGDAERGSFLLPHSDTLRDAWEREAGQA